MRVQWAGRLQVVTLQSKSKAFPVIQSSKPSAQLSLLLAARTCPRGPHAFVVAFTVRRAGPAGYGAATHNTTQYKYSFRKDRSEECTRSHRVVHVSYMTGLTNLKLDRFSTGPTYRNPFPVKISPGETLHSEQGARAAGAVHFGRLSVGQLFDTTKFLSCN